MPSPPQWSYLLDKDNPVKRRRISHVQSIEWYSPTSFHTTGSTRHALSRRSDLRSRHSFHSSPKISHFHTNEDPIVLINDSSEDDSSLDVVPNISMVESDCSDVHIEECVNNGDKRGSRVWDNQVVDIIDDEIAEEVGNAFSVAVSENSDEDVVVSNAIFSTKLDKDITNKKVDSFIAESEIDPQVTVILELPSKKELRTRTSSRLATLLKRLESEKVIRRHKRSKKSGRGVQKNLPCTGNRYRPPSEKKSINSSGYFSSDVCFVSGLFHKQRALLKKYLHELAITGRNQVEGQQIANHLIPDDLPLDVLHLENLTPVTAYD
ncbi:unnamed protein product [Hymenolepis diminuta]|uniref:Uncharacterized protein n=1 Tax=Hymenolepis diminuta TaxID=6216 RepID=A0A0R3SXJ2_HYMDI|nr:unnamed protein product [Hymenolepis diminuta]